MRKRYGQINEGSLYTETRLGMLCNDKLHNYNSVHVGVERVNFRGLSCIANECKLSFDSA